MVTGALVIVSTLAGLFPPLNALNVVAGPWLVVAPWIVGYGTERGPVGLSDTFAGVVIAALASRPGQRDQTAGRGRDGADRAHPPSQLVGTRSEALAITRPGTRSLTHRAAR